MSNLRTTQERVKTLSVGSGSDLCETQLRVKTLSVGSGSDLCETQLRVKILCEQAVPSNTTQILIKVLSKMTRPDFSVWWWAPQDKFTETLEWMTNIIQTFSQEQRISLRSTPRQTFKIQSRLNYQEAADVKSVARTWMPNLMSVPVWSKMSVQYVAAGTTIYLNTEGFEFVPGRRVIVINEGDRSEFELLEIVGVYADRIELATAVSKSYSTALVMALRTVNMPKGISFSKKTMLLTCSAEMEPLDPVPVIDSPLSPVYKNSYVFDMRPNSMDSASESISYDLEKFDSVTGKVLYTLNKTWISNVFSLGYEFHDNEINEFKRFIYAIKGRQKRFYMPSWANDYPLKQAIESSSGNIHVRPPARSGELSGSSIALVTKSGISYHEITGVTVISDEDVQLSIKPVNPHGALNLSDVLLVCRLMPCRLDSDTVQIGYLRGSYSLCNFRVREVPDES